MSATLEADVRINNGPVVKGELRIDRDVVMVESAVATKPDLSWELVDAAGHFHAYDLEGELPTLQSRSVHMDCAGGCGLDDCEGYDVTVYSCRICGEDVEPKRVSDRGPRSVPGRYTWSVTVRTYVPFGETVSLRMMTRAGEFFGVATPTSGTVGGFQGSETTLTDAGPIGRRNLPLKCTCPLINTSSNPQVPEFVLGDPAGCKVHGQARDAEIEARDAEIEAAKRRARGEAPDPFYESTPT